MRRKTIGASLLFGERGPVVSGNGGVVVAIVELFYHYLVAVGPCIVGQVSGVLLIILEESEIPSARVSHLGPGWPGLELEGPEGTLRGEDEEDGFGIGSERGGCRGKVIDPEDKLLGARVVEDLGTEVDPDRPAPAWRQLGLKGPVLQIG